MFLPSLRTGKLVKVNVQLFDSFKTVLLYSTVSASNTTVTLSGLTPS